MLRLVLLLGCLLGWASAFVVRPTVGPFVSLSRVAIRQLHTIHASAEETGSTSDSGGASSLEAKMAAWEATEEEQRAATLGGMIPKKVGAPGRETRTDQPSTMDGFDIGMNISGIILFPLAVILATFPFWIGNIDIASVGPPPTS